MLIQRWVNLWHQRSRRRKQILMRLQTETEALSRLRTAVASLEDCRPAPGSFLLADSTYGHLSRGARIGFHTSAVLHHLNS